MGNVDYITQATIIFLEPFLCTQLRLSVLKYPPNCEIEPMTTRPAGNEVLGLRTF